MCKVPNADFELHQVWKPRDRNPSRLRAAESATLGTQGCSLGHDLVQVLSTGTTVVGAGAVASEAPSAGP